MAPFVPVPNVMRVSFVVTSTTFKGGWRQFFQYTNGPPSQADCQAFATAAANAWNSDLAAITASPLALTQVTCADLNSDVGNVGVWQGSHQGMLATTFAVPADTALLIVHVIQRHYRGGKPRTYLPSGSAQELSSSKSWDATYVANVQAAWGTFINAILASAPGLGTITHVAVAYKQGHMPNPNAGVWGPVNIPAPHPNGPQVSGILAHRVSSIPGSQRRRLRAS
jgi:hypothetical protein